MSVGMIADFFNEPSMPLELSEHEFSDCQYYIGLLKITCFSFEFIPVAYFTVTVHLIGTKVAFIVRCNWIRTSRDYLLKLF